MVFFGVWFRAARAGVLGVQRAESSGWAARRGPPGAGLAGLRAAVTEVGTAPRRRTRLPLALRVPRRLHQALGMPSVLQAASFRRPLQVITHGPPGPLEERNTDVENLIWDVVERPVELLFVADLHRRADPTR